MLAVGLVALVGWVGFKGRQNLIWPDRTKPTTSVAQDLEDEPDFEEGDEYGGPERGVWRRSKKERGGTNECGLPDPGWGKYLQYKKIHRGRVLIPEKGGHTDDMGYDLIVHFHGHDAIRKTLVQTARGVVFAGAECGAGSGAYTSAFADPIEFQAMLDSIEEELKAHTKDPRTHLRHIGLSGWSAGYGAIEAILRNEGDSRIDAVILLDGFHASWLAGAQHNDDPANISLATLMPIVAFAQRANLGEKLFYFSHSEIGTEYPSTTRSGRALLKKLGLEMENIDSGDDPYGLMGRVDHEGFHMRAFHGRDARAHCDHTRHVDEAIADLVERAWQTPQAE